MAISVTVIKENLDRALKATAKNIESRPTLPVLGNVLIRTDETRLEVTSVNMSLGTVITSYVGANIATAGAITLPAKTLGDLVNLMANERVDLRVDEETLSATLKCGKSKSTLRGIDADEFPSVPSVNQVDLVLNLSELRVIINSVTFSAAADDNRPILTGVYTLLEGDTMTMASADGYRLAVATIKLDETFKNPVEMVIPAKSLDTLSKLLSGDDNPVEICFPTDRDIITFSTRNFAMSAQLLEGRFPDFRAIIPRQYNTQIVADREDLAKACQRAEIFARDNYFSGYLTATPPQSHTEHGVLKIASKSTQSGDNEGVVDAFIEGEKLELSFNIKYLLDILKVVSTERVVIESAGSSHPATIRPEGDVDNRVYVIMPMAIR